MVRSSKKLIELVRVNPCLYDKHHPMYLNVTHKRDLWAGISKQMDMPTIKCKTRWNNMRDSYRKATLKKAKTYKYSKHLSFLYPYLKSDVLMEHEFKETASNSDLDWDDNSSSDMCKQEPVSAEATITEASQPYFLPEFKDTNGSVDFTTETPVTPYVCPEHPVDAFLTGIAPSLKCLSPYDVSMAKMEIYQVVHKYELKSIRDQEEAERAEAVTSEKNDMDVLKPGK